MATILLLLDAFRHDYLCRETTPFLWKCAQEGEHYERVVQSLGFCERTEILTGMRGDESGFFTAIGFDPSRSPYANIKGLSFFHTIEQIILFLLRFAPQAFGNKVHKRFRYYVQRYLRRYGITMPSFLIPYLWLPYFALTEDSVDHRLPEAFSKPSIFSFLTEAGKTYSYDTFTALGQSALYTSDQERLDAVRNDLRKEKKDLYLIYISLPDTYGHLFGPEDEKFRELLCEMDQMLARFVEQAEAAGSNNRYLFVGDHGMLPVTEQFDAGAQIERCMHEAGLKKEKDIIYFLDSTMVRLWMMSDRAKESFNDFFLKDQEFVACGIWMDVKTAGRYHVPWPDQRYGDYLWLANPGVLVFPDFFHRIAPCKGMHGYDPQLMESQGVCVRWGEGVESQSCPTMLPLNGVFDVLRKTIGV